MKNIVGVYHGNCIDGTAAAAALLKKFPEAKLFPLAHSYSEEDIAPVLDAVSAESEVYVVDCALGVRELLATGCAATVLDHHVSIQEEMEKLATQEARLTYMFDIEKSGASLTWSYFFPDETQPELITYVEDADLWKWEHGDETRYITSYLSMLRDDPASVLELLSGNVEAVREKGIVITQYADHEIARQMELSSLEMRVGEYVVPAYNITSYQSACGNMLAETRDTAVAMFTLQEGCVRMSMRSKEGQSPTALDIAHELGGGGHVHAAGAEVSLQAFLDMLET